MELEYFNDNDYINKSIIEERNRELMELSEELEDLSELTRSLSYMLSSQSEFLDEMEKTIEISSINVQESNKSLEKSVYYKEKGIQTLKNIAIVVGGVSLGALGFMGGPVIGVATTVSGIAASIGVVRATNKL